MTLADTEPGPPSAAIASEAHAGHTQVDDAPTRAQIDRSCREVVLLWFVSAAFWLLAGTLLAMLASIKLHTPQFLDNTAWLTFGRVRPAHLNTMAYGWASMAGVGTLLWLQARLCKVRLPYREPLYVLGLFWNAVIAYGTVQILAGRGTSVEWLEFPPEVAFALAPGFALLFAVSLRMLLTRRTRHIYVSQWYMFGAAIWFPVLYLGAIAMINTSAATGVVKASANWWYAHNVLGLWLTPIGLAAAYYLIPKVIGRPIHSYYLSILGFWTLAIFYNWAGTHHLIGGPIPAWLVTVGTVGSMMMFIPVITVAINHHFTMIGHFHKLLDSPTLRFIVFGAMSYTLVSVQGSLMALRTVNETSHFTHYTVAHAHLGVYSFFTMSMFGAFYYIVPRLTGREWYSSRLIKIHFWGTALGMAMYWVGLSVGGWWQGMQLNNPDVPFMDIVTGMIPWLWSRSAAGVLMTAGHIAFAVLLFQMLRGRGGELVGPTLLSSRFRAWVERRSRRNE